jgi:hypothetical protein
MPENHLLVALSLLALFLVIGITWGLPPQKGSVPFAPPPVSREVMEANKKAALEFYDLAINKKDYAAASKYLGPDYRQQSALATAKGFREFLGM